MTMRFRIVTPSGWRIVNARDIFQAAELAKRDYRANAMSQPPIAIEEVLAYPDVRLAPSGRPWSELDAWRKEHGE